MESMKDLLKQANDSMQRFSQEFPDKMKGFGAFMKAVETPGALSVKQKELLSVALGVTAHCHWCIAYHVHGALEQGANRAEIMESAWMAVLMGGGPALMYMQLVEEAINEFEVSAKTTTNAEEASSAGKDTGKKKK